MSNFVFPFLKRGYWSHSTPNGPEVDHKESQRYSAYPPKTVITLERWIFFRSSLSSILTKLTAKSAEKSRTPPKALINQFSAPHILQIFLWIFLWGQWWREKKDPLSLFMTFLIGFSVPWERKTHTDKYNIHLHVSTILINLWLVALVTNWQTWVHFHSRHLSNVSI